ncbi:hypothetical protein DCAR_0415308 [Daucus carota subsp. sativus]|uniref:Uncharacterized protein n=1 Tax=Daucus carota subsp. sativus TaxID=79200 RepID=A0A165AA85_DAUCS|nr:hypothetical protein DCAR_0415308 [Daucus carota subsp. sativus]
MRPGAYPLGGLVRPPLIAGPSAGHGRGEYRPAGSKNAPTMQKGHGMPVWANNTPGHRFSRGLNFTLPSYKTVFEVDTDSFEEKPWRLPGVDISDYFNFDLNEEAWKNYLACLV